MAVDTDDTAMRNDTAFRKLARAMAELRIEFGKGEVSTEPTANQQTTALDRLAREAPKPDPTAPETARLPNNTQSQSPSIESGDGSALPIATMATTRSTAAVNQQKGPLGGAENRSTPDTDQVKALRGPATDLEALEVPEPSALIKQAVGEDKIIPVVSPNTNKSKAADEPLTIEPESKSVTDGRQPSVDGSTIASRPTPHTRAHRSPDRPKDGHAVDRFLAELARQLDDIELPPRRSPQR